MDKLISELERKLSKAKEDVSKTQKLIKNIQNICTHQDNNGKTAMEYSGHDSHKKLYKCTKCHYEEWI